MSDSSGFGPDLAEVFGPSQSDGGPDLVQLLTPEGERVHHPDFDYDFSAEELRGLYRDMVLTRRIDVEATALQRHGELGIWAQLLGGEVVVEVGVVDALTLGRQQLDEVGAAIGLGGSEDLRQVGAETGRIGQRTLLSRSWRQSRDRRMPMACQGGRRRV